MLILDYDGVLLNSLDDVVLTGYNAATGHTLESLAELPADYLKLLRLNRFHCQPAGDFILLADALINGRRPISGDIFSKEEYLSIIEGQSSSLKERTNKFFLARERLIEKDETLWLALNSRYQPLWKIARGCAENAILLTNKNKDSVLRSCRHANLMLKEENIYSGDGGVKKQENLVKIIDRFSPEKIEFIDDSIKNLIELDDFSRSSLSIEFKPMLASWGFTGPEDAALP